MTQPGQTGKKKPKIKTAYLIGGGVVAVAVVYYVYKRQSTSTAATSDTSTTDPTIDPTTGIPYADESAGNGYSYPTQAGYTDPYGNVITSGSGQTTTVLTPTNNSQWAQEVEDYFANVLGYDPNTVGNALGKYLTGANLTADQLAIVQNALAFQGAPPSAVPSPHTAPATGQTTPLPTIANGYYRDITTGNIYQVVNETRYALTPTTWKKLETSKNKPTVHTITRSWPGYKIPLSTTKV